LLVELIKHIAVSCAPATILLLLTLLTLLALLLTLLLTLLTLRACLLGLCRLLLLLLLLLLRARCDQLRDSDTTSSLLAIGCDGACRLTALSWS